MKRIPRTGKASTNCLLPTHVPPTLTEFRNSAEMLSGLKARPSPEVPAAEFHAEPKLLVMETCHEK